MLVFYFACGFGAVSVRFSRSAHSLILFTQISCEYLTEVRKQQLLRSGFLFSEKVAAVSMSQVEHSTLCFILLVILLNLVPPQPVESVNCSEPTAQALLTALKDSLLFRTEVRPVISLQTPTVITLDFYIYGILGVQEKGQVLEMFIWLDMVEGVSWDPSECGINQISLPRTLLWMPDIVINEFMDENKVPATYYLYVKHTGHVVDSKPFHVISSCNLDIYTFPFDIQNCSYTFNSYLHTMSDVQLSFADSVGSIYQNSLYTIGTNGEWELIGIIPEKPERDANVSMQQYWDSLIFHIVLRRKPAVYVVNLLLPSCFLVALDVFSFLLPAQHVDRSAFKMTLILGYTVFLLLMNDLLPVTGNNIPLINVFFSVCLALMVGSLLETILVTNLLCGSGGYPRLPRWVRVLLLQYLARLVCLSKHSKPEGEGPVGEGPVGEGPVGEGPVGKVPVGKGPVGEGPVGKGPLGEGPVGEGPVGEGPVGEGPVGKGPSLFNSCFFTATGNTSESSTPPEQTGDQAPGSERPERGEHQGDPALLQELRNVGRDLFSIRQKVEDHLKTDERQEEWIHLGLVIDRVLFVIYIIFITVSFVFILILWLNWYMGNS
ncbi:hypothetical protein NFI96_000325 [Prochilodus magdalenae]|nr:hypothetical protein NFI96_000325 [Prochilodus magdalenae]